MYGAARSAASPLPATSGGQPVADGMLMEGLAEAELVALAREGEGRAFAELYRRNFDPVYDFVARMTRDRDEAADLAQETFFRAMGALGGLRQGARFKSWIFAIARNATLSRLERSSRIRPLSFEGEDGEPVDLAAVDLDRFADPAEAAAAAAMASLAWEAAAGLDPKQLTLLDLHLRQGLDSAEIAGVLGVTKKNGDVMVNRLKQAVEAAIEAFIMWKDGRRYCDALASELAEARTDAMTPVARRLVERHVAHCEDCGERRRRLFSPLAAFGAFAAVGPPADLKAHILEGLMREWPGPAAHPAGSAGSEPPGPRAPEAGTGGFSRDAPWLLMVLGTAAALVLGAVFVPASPFAITGGEGGAPPARDASPAVTSAAGSPSPTAVATPTAKGPTGPATKGALTPTPGKTPTTGGGGGTATTPPPTAAASPGSSPSPTATTTATTVPPTATRTPTTVPCTPSLATNVASLTIAPGNSQTFLAYDVALCGALGFTVSSSAAWIEVEPMSGTIGIGGAVITVRAAASGLPEGKHTGSATVAGATGGGSATVYVYTTVAGAPPVVASATGSCPSGGAQWSFAGHVTDDQGVSSVKLRYTASAGQTTKSMSGPDGATAGDWTLTLAPVEGATGFVVIATDAAGQQTVASVAGNCG